MKRAGSRSQWDENERKKSHKHTKKMFFLQLPLNVFEYIKKIWLKKYTNAAGKKHL